MIVIKLPTTNSKNIKANKSSCKSLYSNENQFTIVRLVSIKTSKSVQLLT